MARIGFTFGSIAALACVPLFFVQSEEAFVAWSWIALTLGGIGGFFLIGRLLEKVAPAMPVDEYERNAFRPRHDPTVPRKTPGTTATAYRKAA